MDAYESNKLALGDKEAKCIEKVEKVAEQRAEKIRKRMVIKASRNSPKIVLCSLCC